MRLEQAQLAHAFGGDTAGGKIGDAASGELKPHVGDIDLGGENGDAGGANLLGRFAGERENDIDIVNHQVQHHIHIQAAQGEFAHAVDFEKQRHGHHLARVDHSGVEALQVSDLEDAAGGARGLD